MQLPPHLLQLCTLHAELVVEGEQVGLVVAVGEDVTEEGRCADGVAAVGGAPSGEEVEAAAVVEREDCVSLGRAPGRRGFPCLPCEVIPLPLLVIRKNLIKQ